MERTVTAGLAGLIITAGAYVSGRRNPRYKDRRRQLDILLGLTAMSFASTIAIEVLT